MLREAGVARGTWDVRCGPQRTPVGSARRAGDDAAIARRGGEGVSRVAVVPQNAGALLASGLPMV